MKKKSIAIAAAMSLAMSGLVAIVVSRGAGDEIVEDNEREEAQVSSEILQERGPRPKTERLREGARQVETRKDALTEAENALERVDAELASAADPASVQRLSVKKKAIEEALKRMKLR